MTRSLDFLRRHNFAIMLLLLLTGIGFHFATVSYSPVHWCDEVHICELARDGIGEKATDWNFDMLSCSNLELNRQSWAFYWLGGFLSEFGYQMFGHSGARIITLMILFVSTLCLWLYVLKKSGSSAFASLVAVLFFSHPMITQSVRGGRFDVLAIGAIVSALAVLQLGHDSRFRERLFFAVSGFFVIVAVFSWITVAVAIPVVFWEMLDTARAGRRSLRDVVSLFAYALIGAVVAMTIFATPFYANIRRTIDIATFVVPSVAGRAGGVEHFKGVFASIFAFPLFLPLALLPLFLWRRYWIVAVGVLAYVFVLMKTTCYVYRMIYFLPYAVVGIVGGYVSFKSRLLKKAYITLLSVMAMFFYGRSVFARNISEYFARPWRDYDKVQAEVASAVGFGVSCFNDSFQLYYLGRELGWKQYAPLGVALCKKELDGVSIYIGDKGRIPEGILKENGFEFYREICTPVPPEPGTVADFLMKANRLSALGPYLIYRRGDGHIVKDH